MNENHSGNQGGLFFLGLFLAIGLIVSAFIISGTVKTVKLSNQTITVKGYAEKDIISDLAIWTGSFTANSFDMISAYEQLERDKATIKKYFEGKGIKADDIEFSSIDTRKIFKQNEKGYTTNYVEGYSLTQTVKIKSSDVKLIEKLANESTDLIQEGIEFFSYRPDYFYTKINDLKIEMLGKATKDARDRAEQMAVNSGSSVGELRSAFQGVFQITPVNSTEISDYGVFDQSSIEKSVKAVVTMDFSIE